MKTNNIPNTSKIVQMEYGTNISNEHLIFPNRNRKKRKEKGFDFFTLGFWCQFLRNSGEQHS